MNWKIRILVIVPEYYPLGSGIGLVAYELNNSLKANSVDIDVISKSSMTFARGGYGLLTLLPFWQYTSLISKKRAFKYDSVWLHAPLMPFPFTLNGIRNLILTFHSTFYGFFNALKSSNAPWIVKNYYNIASQIENNFLRCLSKNKKDYQSITAVSPSVAGELKLNGLTSDVKIIPNSTCFTNTNLDKEKSRLLIANKYSIPLDKTDKILVSVGRLSEIKRPMLLLNLFKNLSRQNAKYKLLIIGNGELSTKLKEFNIKNVYFFGKIEHTLIPVFLKASDAFISLSSYEGLPTTVLEALNVGIPLILSDIPAHKWIVENSQTPFLLINDSELISQNGVLKVYYFMEKYSQENSLNYSKSDLLIDWNSSATNYLKLIRNYS